MKSNDRANQDGPEVLQEGYSTLEENAALKLQKKKKVGIGDNGGAKGPKGKRVNWQTVGKENGLVVDAKGKGTDPGKMSQCLYLLGEGSNSQT